MAMEETNAPPPAAEQRSRRNPSRGLKDTLAVVTAYVLCAALFDQPFTSLVIGLLAALLYQVAYKRNGKVIACLISVMLSFLAFDYFGTSIIRSRIGKTYRLDEDHRLAPYAYPGINGDGLRCAFEADDFTAATFNIIFLGDSFVYGERIDSSDDVFPNQLEAMIQATAPPTPVRTINFGWISSSPLLSARRLEDIGVKYKPDLVILLLDMTDFHDDLRYRHGPASVGAAPFEYLALRAGFLPFLAELRSRSTLAEMLYAAANRGEIVPKDRFFMTSAPFNAQRDASALTEYNIRAIDAFCRQTLGCDFMLVMPPRSYQYSSRECPDNWEAHAYTTLGPYAEQPFKWLAAFGDEVGFPCISLLDDFKQSTVFPLFLEDDPHWNVAGHKFVAGLFLEILRERSYLTPDDTPQVNGSGK